ncbi:hypothetical protein [Ensifer sp. ZNC0028]|uniref:hypothetical protein n=1 Tax=Ensifer sp. ZNC0028 TaxID=1339236 RepID=UPI0005B872B8|nr:hypothetical protein [Ensifer sp. ZNC0028]
MTQRFQTDRAKVPSDFPTHLHASEFWEELGRTVATFGFLEETLGKAIFALTATREYPEDEIQKAYEKWLKVLERAISDPLGGLITSYEAALRAHQNGTPSRSESLIANLKEAARLRNVLCHGSWGAPNSDGASKPKFVSNKLETFEEWVDVSFLAQTRKATAHMICDVIDSVAQMGFQFPGSNGPGKVIWETSSASP